MIANNAWVCPILPKEQDNAFYSVKKDHIVVPMKHQFVDGESYYGTVFHEMIHSTGADNRLGRLKTCVFGDKDYAREELVAELGSALICQENGISKHLKSDSAAYLKSWLSSLSASPEFIKSVMTDVKRASSIVNNRMEDVQHCLDNGQPVLAYKSEPRSSNTDNQDTVAAMGTPPKKPNQSGAFREVDVISLFGALKRDGEAKLADHYMDSKSNDKEESVSQSKGRGR